MERADGWREIAQRTETRAVARARRAAAEARGEPHLHAAACDCVIACVQAALSGSPGVPAEVSRLARLWAQLRLELPTLLRGVGLVHGELSRLWLDEVSAAALADRARDELLRATTRAFFDYADEVAGALAAAFERERALAGPGRRLELVRRVLAGDEPDTGSLGYPLEATHFGIVGWGARARDDVRLVAAALPGHSLVLEVSDELVWAWTGARGFEDGWQRRLARITPAAATIAVGMPSRGVDGFRQSHEEAIAAARVAARRPAAVTLYRDVALEALALRDEPLARTFVDRELGPLADAGDRARRLRRTLRVYLGACGQNAAATAAALGVHDQTVRYQLRGIESRLGTAIADRHAELAAALRLHALLAD